MNNYSNNFKGIWFPKEIRLDKNISLIEKCILVVIEDLNKYNNYCTATNMQLANFLQCSQSTITKAISHLKKMGYIEEIKLRDTDPYRNLRIKSNINDEQDYVWDTQEEEEELKQLIEQELERKMLLHPKYYKNVRI